MKKYFYLAAILAALSSCTMNYSMGDYTAISTMNVRGFNRDVEKSKSYGEKCASRFLIFWFGDTEALGINSLGALSSFNMKPAIDEAIENGRIKGTKQGDILVDARIKVRDSNYLLVGKRCLIVEGDLISSK